MRTFFPGIQALRAIAALFVVVEHALFAANRLKGMPYASYYPLTFGYVGVILFFAISGFVIALNRHKPVGEFALHRLLRIYPSYWIAMLLAAALGYAARQQLAVIPSEVLLFPSSVTNFESLKIPYWTLIFETTFYVVACIAFAWRLSDRTLTIIALAWIAAVGIAGVTMTQYPAGWILLSPWTQLFPMGLIASIHFERLRSFGRWPFVVAAVLLAAANYRLSWDLQTGWKCFLVGLCCAMIVIACADIRVPHVVKRLGDSSYGIYLLHYPPIFALAYLVPQSGYWSFLILGTLAGTVFGLFDHWLYRRLTRPRR